MDLAGYRHVMRDVGAMIGKLLWFLGTVLFETRSGGVVLLPVFLLYLGPFLVESGQIMVGGVSCARGTVLVVMFMIGVIKVSLHGVGNGVMIKEKVEDLGTCH